MATITVRGTNYVVRNIPEHKRGDTWDGISFRIIVGGVPLNLSGAKIDLEFRKRPHNNPSYLYSTTNSKIVITDAVNGRISVVGGIIDFEVGIYDYDVQITLSDGSVKTRIVGQWSITKDITR